MNGKVAHISHYHMLQDWTNASLGWHLNYTQHLSTVYVYTKRFKSTWPTCHNDSRKMDNNFSNAHFICIAITSVAFFKSVCTITV